jgi:hypothetical protein
MYIRWRRAERRGMITQISSPAHPSRRREWHRGGVLAS